ncbi:hypothetical protein [Phaeovulum vinaykumarii]|uniref:Antifreeze glycopeptide polyprotein n=1 Tax=Phaeovulum vinaykumarii TaxID=407234 RepID=A0A1N7LMM1_9RHOB|nr:hypothetical protein [Phaeovulum vinaykumarii]SIS75034.1 hypothetical protein SAMN05421795_103252 [Phaeovulum vinaykumarii]SOC05454.1 hypothetical protein SAMN05878426_103252 [Phaeovulum vinaykumarii]
MRGNDGAILLLCGQLAWAGAAGAETAPGAPLSSIDWLSQSLEEPADGAPRLTPAAGAVRPGVSGSHSGASASGAGGTVRTPDPALTAPDLAGLLAVDPIDITPLDAPDPETAGLLGLTRSGLPKGLWGATPEGELARLVRREGTQMPPALHHLFERLLLAELDPPRNRAGSADRARNSLFLARIDRLLEMGALEPAYALLMTAGTADPERLKRLFDVALLLGEEERACDALRAAPGAQPALAARIFCLARAGDWPAADLAFTTGRNLEPLDPLTEDLLERFLDPEMADGAADLPPPARVTPLTLRLYEAIGQALPTANLPLAFAQSDLGAQVGWKARLEAAERLARAGAIDPNQLLGLYTERAAAASGGVWERVAAVSALDAALGARDPARVSAALPRAIAAMRKAGLETQLAGFAARAVWDLAPRLTPQARAAAFRLGLLSEDYETIAHDRRPVDDAELLLKAVAQGGTARVPETARRGALAEAITAAFDTLPPVGPPYADLVAGDRLGEALLLAIEDIARAARGDTRDLTRGLVLLRNAGLETVARRVSLELLLAEEAT